MKKERILLKISGSNLKRDDGFCFFSHDALIDLSKQIKILSKECDIAIVVGGGNIWRGRNKNEDDCLQEKDSHVIGMMSTMMNSIVLQNYLKSVDVESVIFSAISCPRVAEDLNSEKIDGSLDAGKVVIFAGGSGSPFVTTDTCAAIRALEIGAKKIFVGKNETDGIYDMDPNIHRDAKFFERISYEDIISKNLLVMDLSSMCILKDNGRPNLIVFNQSIEDSFVKVYRKEIQYSEVY